MKTIGNFGAFVRETWYFWLSLPFMVLFVLFHFDGQTTVTLDSKHWECTMSRPDGLGARCLEYVYKGK